MAYLNGRLPGAVLGNIAQGRLRKDAAKAFNAMNMESEARFGVTLHPTGSMSSYRTLAQQQYLWNLYIAGRGNLAARPGTSNHGWGLAIDLATQQMRQIVDQIGEPYGFAKKWSDASSEWWHIKFRTGVWKPNHRPYGLRPLGKGARGFDVLALKQDMWRRGLRGYSRFSPTLGPSVVEAIKRFQRNHNLKDDGVVGSKTWHLLR